MKGNSDDEAIRMANNCDFALSSCAFSGSYNRAAKIASQLTAGPSVSTAMQFECVLLCSVLASMALQITVTSSFYTVQGCLL